MARQEIKLKSTSFKMQGLKAIPIGKGKRK